MKTIALLLLFSVAGCYNPSIPSRGFRCAPDKPACPDNFYCLDGYCVDSIPNSSDLAQLPAGDLATPPGPPDLAQSCSPTGGQCTVDGDCCGNYCIYKKHKCR